VPLRLVPDGQPGRVAEIALDADGALTREGLRIGSFNGRALVADGRTELWIDASYPIHLAGRPDLELHFTTAGTVLISYRPARGIAAALHVEPSGVPVFQCGEGREVRVKAHFADYRPEMAFVAALLALYAAPDALLEAVPVKT
jgi:hypothetical protein